MSSDVPEDRARRLFLLLTALLLFGGLSLLATHLFHALSAPALNPHAQH